MAWENHTLNSNSLAGNLWSQSHPHLPLLWSWASSCGLHGNTIMVLLIYLDTQLHTPMYHLPQPSYPHGPHAYLYHCTQDDFHHLSGKRSPSLWLGVEPRYSYIKSCLDLNASCWLQWPMIGYVAICHPLRYFTFSRSHKICCLVDFVSSWVAILMV